MIRKNQDEPMYVQIYDELRQGIENGTLKDGEKLISERQLAAQLGLSRATTRKAFHMLMEQNLIVKSPKKGSYVVNSMSEQHSQEGYMNQ